MFEIFYDKEYISLVVEDVENSVDYTGSRVQ